jgi:Holliday junction resolvase RusA-like endonuclease
LEPKKENMHEMRQVRSATDGAKNVFVITINVLPKPWTAPRVCRGVTYSKHTKVKRAMQVALKGAYTGPMISSALICDISFYMPIPLSMPKKLKERALKGLLRPSNKPDRTNMAKLAEDALEGIVIENDKLIVGGNIEKFYAAVPKIVYLIEILP